MAEQQSGLSIQNIGIGLGIAVLLLIAGSLFLGSNGTDSCNQPCPNGSTTQIPIDTTNPRVTALTGELSKYTKPNDFLIANSEKLDGLITQVTAMKSGLESGSAEFSSIPNKEAVLPLLTDMISQLQTIKGTSQTDKKKAQAAAAQFLTDAAALDKLFVVVKGGIVAIAKAIADQNIADNGAHSRYPKPDVHTNVTLGPTGIPDKIDCSFFIDYVLYKAGIFPNPLNNGYSPSVAIIYDLAKKGKYQLSLVADAGLGGSLSDDQVKSVLQPGDIIISNLAKKPHIVMYVGPNLDSPNNIVESGGDKKISPIPGDGPGYDTLASRLERPTTAIVRLTNTEAITSKEVPANNGGSKVTTPTKGDFIVCIDPGHPSDYSNGTSGFGITEVQVAQDIADRMKTYLTAKSGVRVVMTKTSTLQKVTNRHRSEICNNAGANLMLRLHADGAAESEHGFTFYYADRSATKDGVTGPSDDIQRRSLALTQRLQTAFAKNMNGKIGSNPIRTDAQTAAGAKQGGVLTGSIFAKIPATLIEMFNMKNEADATYFKSDTNKQFYAEQLSEAILTLKDNRP